MEYIWSDLHLYHDNVIRFSGRPYEDAAEMNAALFKAWRETIKKGDVLWNLGDYSWYPKKDDILKSLTNLPGKKILLLGNHDRGKSVRWWREAGFDEVYDYPIVYNDRLIFSHEDMNIPDDFYMVNVHGHHHEKDMGHPRKFNVSVERIGYKPITIESIMEKYDGRI
jgi:calcineurin-like phosphoesterase family protein